MSSAAKTQAAAAAGRGDARLLHLSVSVNRACERFLASRGEGKSQGFRDIIGRSARLTKLAKARTRQQRQDKADTIAVELEKGWV